jgi:hypothetical protein
MKPGVNFNTVSILKVPSSPFSQSRTRSIKHYRPLAKGDITNCAPTIPMAMGEVGNLFNVVCTVHHIVKYIYVGNLVFKTKIVTQYDKYQ